MASLRAGWGGAELDTAGALAMAVAAGCPPRLAAPLLAQMASGIREGLAEREDGEPADDQRDRG